MTSARNISVLIPTCNRPHFLRTALRSVQEQTAIDRVGEVVVIENGGTRDSERLRDEFPKLPIRYVFRDPPLAPEHLARPALAELREEWVAVLFDDDWWTKYHLESACQALDANRDAVAYFCNALFTTGEDNSYIDHIYHAWLPWFATKGKSTNGLHVFSLIDMIVATLITTPFHLSSMVIKRPAYVTSLHVFDRGNPYDVDRLLEVELARQGPVLFRGHPGVYVRMHPGQEVMRLGKSGEAEKWFNDSTQRILTCAKEAGVDVKKEFADRLAATGNELTRLCAASNLGSVRFLEEQGLLPPMGEADQMLRYEETIATLVKQEAEHRKTIEGIMKSKTFQVGKTLSKIRTRLRPAP